MPRVGRRDVHLSLLVLGPVVGHVALVAELLEGLTQARDIAVAEDAPDAGDEPRLDAVTLDVLLRKEPDDRLPDRQPHRAQGVAPLLATGARGPLVSGATASARGSPPSVDDGTACNRLQPPPSAGLTGPVRGR